ncbi:hypothetical protein ACRAWD_23030 [Caulobacter segnis]
MLTPSSPTSATTPPSTTPGTSLTNAPKWQGALSANYDREIGCLSPEGQVSTTPIAPAPGARSARPPTPNCPVTASPTAASA